MELTKYILVHISLFTYNLYIINSSDPSTHYCLRGLRKILHINCISRTVEYAKPLI